MPEMNKNRCPAAPGDPGRPGSVQTDSARAGGSPRARLEEPGGVPDRPDTLAGPRVSVADEDSRAPAGAGYLQGRLAAYTADDHYEALAERFRPVFGKIAARAVERERTRTHAHEELRWLVDAGFGLLRLPADYGGLGARLSDLFRLLAELAEADPNLAQVWRNHFSFIEDRISATRDETTRRWLEKLAAGTFIGGGWTDKDAGAGEVTTRLIRSHDREGWTLTGTKYYSTGSNHADYNTVLALTPDGEQAVALVPTAQSGVEVRDDWDGFGQTLSGSGTVVYTDAFVEDIDVIPYATRYTYQSQYYQTALNAVVTGIVRAIARDGVAALKARRRAHRNNVAEEPARDPQLLEVIGRLVAHAQAADASLKESARLIDAVVAAERADDEDARAVLAARSQDAVEAAQLTIGEHALTAASIVFDALGASGTSAGLALDRHWRNARTLISHNPRVARARLLGERAIAAE
ncbi:acyl-CoA dehydrogenase family protein [Sediminivirga luteola]|uniref:Dibenzothiophene monooxygenase n=1 Tax=Sediminivirga luteola TaxID=1774748 RepID=A0A8J2U0H5_9MICO|nr:acyl-CoA dehydrogenase family protein [Sediminivirga luteola]MCI2265036.1 acyl-CoA dehydrogenase family protein [Sediminivirga luteola]GGA25291.1 acyl-CoA dehydrogenase [Sediminivirga luteola]